MQKAVGDKRFSGIYHGQWDNEEKKMDLNEKVDLIKQDNKSIWTGPN